MSYTSNKNLLSTTGVAVLASLGIHGLLWAVLPGLTLDSQTDKSPSQRTIGLVDLSPQEQSRLPQVSNPIDNNLPAFASQLSALPPLPPSPPYQTRVEPPLQLLPGSAPIYNTIPNQISPPPLQTFRVPLPPPPTNTSFPPIPYENLPSSLNNPPLPSPPQAPPFVLPANNGLPNTPLTPDRTLPSEDDVATATPSPEPSLPPSPDNSNTPNPPVTDNQLPKRGKEELLAMRESMRNNFPPSAATQPTNARSMSRQEIAAALRGQNRSNQAPPTQTNARSMSRQEIAAALRGQPLSEDTKTALDNLEKFKQHQARVQDQNPDAVTKPPIRRKLTTCDRSIDGAIAVVGVVVNPEGKRLSEPNLINKTGKADITLAQNYVRDYEFAKTGKTTNYNFRLEFDYSANKCTQAPTPSPSPATNTSPEPTPRVTPTPSNPASTSIPTPSPKPESVAPSLEPTNTPQISPPPSNSQKPKDMF